MGEPSIQLYYDVVSPFGYMAYYTLRNSPVFQNVKITYSPIFLGAIMKACNNRPPIDIKNKDKWIDKDRTRWAKTFSIPMAASAPDGFPVNTLPCTRALCVLERTNPDKLIPATDAIFHAIWGPPRNEAVVHKPEGLTKILTEVLGEDETKRVMQDMGSDENKKHLTDSVNKALEDGAFGVPYFVVTGSDGKKETYWGFNYLGMIATQLGLQRDSAQQGWSAML